MKRRLSVFPAILFLMFAVATAPAQTQNFTVLHEFNGTADGANPEGKLLRDAAGNLYGTTFAGGAVGEGTVYTIDNTGKEKILFTFSGEFQTGGFPATPLIRDQAGNLYGIADGGPGGAGIVYKISPDGKETILFAFQGCLSCHNPRVPTGGIVMDKLGNLYGTTLFGGTGSCQSGCGTIFRLDTAGALHVLYSFTGGADGSQPFGPLAPDTNGNLYGVTEAGGDMNCVDAPQVGCGTVFQLSRAGKLKVVHTFKGGADGANPQPDLLIDAAAGNLYGAASRGGKFDQGMLFRISSNGRYTALYSFTGQDDGARPRGGLVLDAAGNLFGEALTGGRGTDGTVFAINPAGQIKVLHTFEADLDGAFPTGGLISDGLGHLFGTAIQNGLVDQRNGDVFEVRP